MRATFETPARPERGRRIKRVPGLELDQGPDRESSSKIFSLPLSLSFSRALVLILPFFRSFAGELVDFFARAFRRRPLMKAMN